MPHKHRLQVEVSGACLFRREGCTRGIFSPVYAILSYTESRADSCSCSQRHKWQLLLASLTICSSRVRVSLAGHLVTVQIRTIVSQELRPKSEYYHDRQRTIGRGGDWWGFLLQRRRACGQISRDERRSTLMAWGREPDRAM